MKIAARVLLTLGFLAASVSYSSWIVHRTVLDSSATRDATHALITAPTVRTALAKQLRSTLEPQLGHLASDPRSSARLTAALNAAVADPRFVGAFDNAITSLHDQILSGAGAAHGGRITLDTHAVTAALHSAAAHHDPALAQRIKTIGPVALPIGSNQLPHIGSATRDVGRVGLAAGAIAVVLIGGALLLAHNRKTIGRVGRRTALLAVEPALVFALLPRLLDARHGNAETVTAAILRAYGHPVMFSAIAFVVVGVSIWLISLALPILGFRRAEPAPVAAPAAPTRSRGHRAGRPSEEPTAVLPEKLYL